LNTISADIKAKLAESKEYREEFVAALVKRAFARQVKTIRKARGLSQEELAADANVDQGVISRAENPNYGNLTFNTGFRVAAGFDLAFIPKLVTFGEFLEWIEEVTSGFTDLPSFEEEAQQEAIAETFAGLGKKVPAHAGLELVWDRALSGTQEVFGEQKRIRNNQFAAGTGAASAAMGGEYGAGQRSAG
jgi:transcriptional regulator with XRE-family HTH domain